MNCGYHPVCPVNAGIVPWSTTAGSPSRCLPCTYRDHPKPNRTSPHEYMSALYMQGSSARPAQHLPCRRVCPVHAGIDLRAHPAASARRHPPCGYRDRAFSSQKPVRPLPCLNRDRPATMITVVCSLMSALHSQGSSAGGASPLVRPQIIVGNPLNAPYRTRDHPTLVRRYAHNEKPAP